MIGRRSYQKDTYYLEDVSEKDMIYVKIAKRLNCRTGCDTGEMKAREK